MTQTPEGDFSRQEAHDCVIDLADELIALSERVQARKKAAGKNISSSLHCRHSNALTTTTSICSEIEVIPQPNMTKTGPSRPVPIPDMPSDGRSAESFGFTQPFVLPHLRTPKQQGNSTSKAPFTQKSLLPPHLRGLKQNTEMLQPTEFPNNYTTPLDSKEYLKSSKEVKQPVLQRSPPLNVFNKGTVGVASDQGSSESVSDNFSAVKLSNEHREKALQTASRKPSVSPNTTASEHEDERNAIQLASMSSSNPIDVKKAISSPENPILKTSLTSSFLDKWGSRGSTSFPKASIANGTEPENLMNQLTFKAWPGQTARSGPSAQTRTCHLKNLPSYSTPAFICSIIFGGALERVQVHRSPDAETTTATVRFLSGDACKSFYDATANGLPLKSSGPGSREMVAWVTLGREVDVVGGLLAQQIEQGVTRCVRAVPVDARLEAIDLVKLAGQKGRRLEGLEDGLTTQNGSRFVVWRFCGIPDAVAFRGVLAREDDFESCNISFSEDPCALREMPDL